MAFFYPNLIGDLNFLSPPIRLQVFGFQGHCAKNTTSFINTSSVATVRISLEGNLQIWVVVNDAFYRLQDFSGHAVFVLHCGYIKQTLIKQVFVLSDGSSNVTYEKNCCINIDKTFCGNFSN